MLGTTAMEVGGGFFWMILKSPLMKKTPCFFHVLVGWQRTLVMEKWKEKYTQEQELPTHQARAIIIVPDSAVSLANDVIQYI